MHISVSLINCMWIAFHILHRVVKCCNLRRKMHERIINNFNIILMISWRCSIPWFGATCNKTSTNKCILIKMIRNEIWMKTQNTNLREYLKAVHWLCLDGLPLKSFSAFATLRNILRECRS